MQDCSTSIADALEILQSSIKPSISWGVWCVCLRRIPINDCCTSALAVCKVYGQLLYKMFEYFKSWIIELYWLLVMGVFKHYRANSRLALSQWETSLQSNAISHWLDTNLESALHYIIFFNTGTIFSLFLLFTIFKVWDVIMQIFVLKVFLSKVH